MPISIEVDLESQLTIRRVKGTVTFDELIELLKDPSEWNLTPYLLWDFREGSIKNFSSGEIQEIADMVSRVSVVSGYKKAAGVHPKDIDFGLGSMLHAYMEIKGYKQTFKIFHEYEDAVTWLTGDETLLEKSA